MVTDNTPGRPGGKIVVALRSEPKTLNPVLAEDAASRDVIRCLTADLIDINRATQKTEPALAKSWTVAPDGRQYTLHLRRGLRFSDGQPLDADDVVFSFRSLSRRENRLAAARSPDRRRKADWRAQDRRVHGPL